MTYLGKRELELLIKKAEKFYQVILELGKKEHDCVYSIVLLKQEGKIEILKELYEKYYIIKRKDTFKKRKKQSIEMLEFQINRVEKRAYKLLHSQKTEKYIDISLKIGNLKKQKEKIQEN